MSDDESSFVILGSTPTPSMEQYDGHENSLTKEKDSSITSNAMQSSSQTIQNFSLVNSSIPPLMGTPSSSLSASNTADNLKIDSPVNSTVNKDSSPAQSMMKSSTASGIDFAEQFLLGEMPPDSLKYTMWKNFPSFCTPKTNVEDVGKLESLINEHIKLKDNLQKTNEAMHQHFSTINKWQTRVKELKETQANEIAKCSEVITSVQEQLRLKTVENENLHVALLERDEFNQKLKLEIARVKEEHEEKTMQFNMNLAYAAGENKDLVQEISGKNAIIQNLTNMIEKLEKQVVASTATFEMVSRQCDGQQQSFAPSSSLSQSHSIGGNGSSNHSPRDAINSERIITDFAAQLNAAREQNIQLLEDVSGKIATIKRLESESSKLQHQLLSLEMIVNENGQRSTEDSETVRVLKDELNQMSIQNIQIRETVQSDYITKMDQLRERLAREEERYQSAHNEIENLRSEIDAQNRNLSELTAKIAEQQADLTELQKANVMMRSAEINRDIVMHQKDQELHEIKDENEFLKAQLDVYKSDFEMERQSRQDIANEREELLSDLKLLQRRNQQLIEEAQARNRNSGAPSSPGASSSTASAPTQSSVEQNRNSAGRFVCPVCNMSSPNLMALQTHVQGCLEN